MTLAVLAVLLLLLSIVSSPEAGNVARYSDDGEYFAVEDGDESEDLVRVVDHETPDILVVGTVDGGVHGIGPDGTTFWSNDNVGGPTIKSYQTRESGMGGAVVPGEDGLLYLFSEENGLALHHLSIKDLVNASPFTESLGENKQKIRVIGEKKTSIFELDPNTGARLRVFTSESGSLLEGKWEDEPSPQAAQRFTEGEAPFEGAPPISIGRVDFRVRAFDASSGVEVWNFTYGQFISNQKDVVHLDPNSLDTVGEDLDLPQRFTIGGMPVTAVFGAQRIPNARSQSWRFVSELSIGQAGQNVIGDISRAKEIYLQRIHFKNGESQVYATTGRPGKPLACSETVFPASNGDSESAVVPRSVNGAAASQQTCKVNQMDDDFPLQGPHRVTNQIQIFSDAVTVQKSFLPQPKDEQEDVPSRVVPKKQLKIPNLREAKDDVRTLQTAVALLLVLLTYFVFQSWGSQNGGGNLALNTMLETLTGRSSGGLDFSPQGQSTREVVFDAKNNTERVGDLVVSLDSVLGRGCQGTTVLKGSLRGRPVAVKKVLASQFKLAEKEIELLIRSDKHPNIVRYYHTEVTRDFIFLALELCDSTLESAVSQVREINKKRKDSANKSARKNLRIPSGCLSFLEALASATHHLHTLRIIHCDIKPANILVVSKKDGADQGSLCEASQSESLLLGIGDIYEPKLSDMGLGRKFSGTTSSIFGGTSIHGSGTVGWRAPELLRGLTSNGKKNVNEHDIAVRLGRKVDVFSLGCVFFYVISGGHHPFGEHLDRERNILEGNPVNLDRIKHYPLAHDLIGKMIQMEASQRPTIEECLLHPLLWKSSLKLEFIKHVSDRLEADRGQDTKPKAFSVPETLLHERFEKDADTVIGKQGWLQRLHPVLRQDVVDSKRRYYATHSLRDLLRYIRNRLSHFHELDGAIRELLSPLPDGFLDQFLGSNRFPNLLLFCYDFVLETCAHEAEFEKLIGSPIAAKFSPDSSTWLERKSKEDLHLKPRTPPRSPEITRSKTFSVSDGTDSAAEDLIERSMSMPLNDTPPSPTLRPSGLRTTPGGNGGDTSPVTPPRKQREDLNWRQANVSVEALNGGRNPFASLSNSLRQKQQSPPTNGSPVNGLPASRPSKPPKRYTGDPKKDPNYKTKLCLNWENSNGTYCKMGERCFFAHGSEELREKPA